MQLHSRHPAYYCETLFTSRMQNRSIASDMVRHPGTALPSDPAPTPRFTHTMHTAHGAMQGCLPLPVTMVGQDPYVLCIAFAVLRMRW
jgi:hypothetical protein